MVSHCVPDALGGADRARAWQLLKLANTTHRVFLACLLDGPVNLSQWRNADAHAQQLAIEIDHRATRHISRLKQRSARRADANRDGNTALAAPIEQWQSEHHFDAIWCTHPVLWPTARGYRARLRLCDTGPESQAGSSPDNGRLDPLTAIIAHQANALTIDRNAPHHRWRDCPCEPVALPTTVDLAFFTDAHANRLTKRYAPPGLHVVVHHDWTRPNAHRALKWFTKRVWPQIHRAAPDAYLRNTMPGSLDPLATLRDASVVVCVDPNSHQAKLPVYQAMAMQRAVVASNRALNAPALNRHIMSVDRTQDWSRVTLQLLRSASERLSLSRNAREWIDHQPATQDHAKKLAHLLSGTPASPQTMPKAA